MKLQLNRSWCKAVVIGLAFIFAGIAVLWGLNYWETNYNNAADGDGDIVAAETIFFGDSYYKPQKHIKTVLAIGLDKFAEDEVEESAYMNDRQADFLVLLIIDRDNETCKALQINRDTMTDIQILGVRGEKGGTFRGQIALSHTYGSGAEDSCRNVVDAVENLLYGIKIDHYVSFTMDAVPKINDIVGGVTLTLLDDFSHVSPDYTKGAEVCLKGDMALTYVRGRYGVGDETNLSRMERQKQYLSAFGKKLEEIDGDSEELLTDVVMALAEYMVSDTTVDQLSRIYDEASQHFDGEILSIKGEAVKGEKNMEFYVDEEALQHQVIDLFYTPVDAPAESEDSTAS